MSQTHTDSTLLSWEAPSKAQHHRSARWYLVGGIACAMAVAYGVLSGAWSMSVTFGMIGGLYLLTRNESPRMRKIRIDRRGIIIDESFTSWSACKEFWILQDGDTGQLHLSRDAAWKPDIVVRTGEIDLFDLRDIMSQFLPQNPRGKERILDTFIRFCKL